MKPNTITLPLTDLTKMIKEAVASHVSENPMPPTPTPSPVMEDDLFGGVGTQGRSANIEDDVADYIKAHRGDGPMEKALAYDGPQGLASYLNSIPEFDDVPEDHMGEIVDQLDTEGFFDQTYVQGTSQGLHESKINLPRTYQNSEFSAPRAMPTPEAVAKATARTAARAFPKLFG